MKIQLSSDALADLEEGFDFYQQQAPGLGNYFIASLTADIEALNHFGGVHQIVMAITERYQDASLSASTTSSKQMI